MLKNLYFIKVCDWLRGQDLNLRPSGYEHSELGTQNPALSMFPMGLAGSYRKNPPITGNKNYHITTTRGFLRILSPSGILPKTPENRSFPSITDANIGNIEQFRESMSAQITAQSQKASNYSPISGLKNNFWLFPFYTNSKT